MNTCLLRSVSDTCWLCNKCKWSWWLLLRIQLLYPAKISPGAFWSAPIWMDQLREDCSITGLALGWSFSGTLGTLCLSPMLGLLLHLLPCLGLLLILVECPLLAEGIILLPWGLMDGMDKHQILGWKLFLFKLLKALLFWFLELLPKYMMSF